MFKSGDRVRINLNSPILKQITLAEEKQFLNYKDKVFIVLSNKRQWCYANKERNKLDYSIPLVEVIVCSFKDKDNMEYHISGPIDIFMFDKKSSYVERRRGYVLPKNKR